MSEQSAPFFLLWCRECNAEPEVYNALPFDTAEARGKWAAAHRQGTGHDKWVVIDQQPKAKSA